jgi:hypothetical protein
MKIRLFGIFRKKKKCVFKISKSYSRFVDRNAYYFISGYENRLIGEKSNYKWKMLRSERTN